MVVALTANAQTAGRLARPGGAVMTPTAPSGSTTLSLIPAGPAPVGLSVSGTPAAASVAWQAMPNATSYSISRWLKNDPTVCRGSSGSLTSLQWSDGVGAAGCAGTFVYSLSASYADGSVGTAQVEWTSPLPTNPASLTGTVKGDGIVELTWPAVAGASYYLLWGPGLANGTQANGTTYTVQGVPAGPQEFTVGAYFLPGPVSTVATAFTKGRVTVRRATENYRVTINGFTVNHATSENWLNSDGVSDEDYASAFVQIFDRASQRLLMAPAVVESAVHGDVSNWNGRVRAGSATASGGIQGGDAVPMNTNPAVAPTGAPSRTALPLVVFEGPLTAGKEVVVIRPVLWEWDGTRSAFDTWRSTFMQSAPDATFGAIRSEIEDLSIRVTLGGYLLTAHEGTQGVLNSWERDIGPGVDRPIGLAPVRTRYGGTKLMWQDRLVVLTKEKIDAALDAPYTTGALGILSIQLKDVDASDIPYSGDYTLYVRVERIP